MKKELFKYIAGTTGKRFDPNVLTITWARRFADYKRAWMILMQRDKISKLLNHLIFVVSNVSNPFIYDLRILYSLSKIGFEFLCVFFGLIDFIP